MRNRIEIVAFSRSSRHARESVVVRRRIACVAEKQAAWPLMFETRRAARAHQPSTPDAMPRHFLIVPAEKACQRRPASTGGNRGGISAAHRLISDGVSFGTKGSGRMSKYSTRAHEGSGMRQNLEPRGRQGA